MIFWAWKSSECIAGLRLLKLLVRVCCCDADGAEFDDDFLLLMLVVAEELEGWLATVEVFKGRFEVGIWIILLWKTL